VNPLGGDELEMPVIGCPGSRSSAATHCAGSATGRTAETACRTAASPAGFGSVARAAAPDEERYQPTGRGAVAHPTFRDSFAPTPTCDLYGEPTSLPIVPGSPRVCQWSEQSPCALRADHNLERRSCFEQPRLIAKRGNRTVSFLAPRTPATIGTVGVTLASVHFAHPAPWHPACNGD